MPQRIFAVIFQKPSGSAKVEPRGETVKYTSRLAALIASGIAFATTTSEARAQTAITFGWGGASCGLWLQHPSENDAAHLAMGAWLDGYLTATNEALAHVGKPTKVGATTDTAGRDAWVTTYCQGHPLDLLYTAARALVAELEKIGR
jgi:hypothetical protein